MAPELFVPFILGSLSSIPGAVAFTIVNLSKQRTLRIKHSQTIDLDRERLRLVLAAYERDAAQMQAADLVGLTNALRGALTLAGDDSNHAFPAAGTPPALTELASEFLRSRSPTREQVPDKSSIHTAHS